MPPGEVRGRPHPLLRGLAHWPGEAGEQRSEGGPGSRRPGTRHADSGPEPEPKGSLGSCRQPRRRGPPPAHTAPEPTPVHGLPSSPTAATPSPAPAGTSGAPALRPPPALGSRCRLSGYRSRRRLRLGAGPRGGGASEGAGLARSWPGREALARARPGPARCPVLPPGSATQTSSLPSRPAGGAGAGHPVSSSPGTGQVLRSRLLPPQHWLSLGPLCTRAFVLKAPQAAVILFIAGEV